MMSTTTKSPRRVLEEALLVGQRTLRTYAHRFSPKKFTQPQLFACLVLKEFLQLDYRKLSALLQDTPTLAATIGLGRVPHFTTFHKAASRLLKSRRAGRLLDETVGRAKEQRLMKSRVKTAAVDGTGFETRHISAYFIKLRKRGKNEEYQTARYTRYPYATIVCDCLVTNLWMMINAV